VAKAVLGAAIVTSVGGTASTDFSELRVVAPDIRCILVQQTLRPSQLTTSLSLCKNICYKRGVCPRLYLYAHVFNCGSQAQCSVLLQAIAIFA